MAIHRILVAQTGRRWRAWFAECPRARIDAASASQALKGRLAACVERHLDIRTIAIGPETRSDYAALTVSGADPIVRAADLRDAFARYGG